MTDNLPATTGDNRLSLGQTQLDASDLILPRVKLVQKMSDEFDAKGDGPKEGDFLNVLTRENYGPTLRFVPLVPFKQRVLLVRDERRAAIVKALEGAGYTEPLSEGKGLKCRSYDMFTGIGEPGIACNDCPLSKWEGNTPPLCTETYNVASMTEYGELIILSFAKSSAKAGKALFSMIRMKPGAPWQAIYEVESRSQKNDQGTFAVAEARRTTDPLSPELLQQAVTWAGQLEGAMIDVTPVDEEGSDDSSPF